ncbi:interferon type A1/A2-like [Erythrolamprus reginae]|uniref:interferon type A1/A2-like n=1 Tax=Erythrolamprus reginae TaxID=121349 RepID=UPI00396C892D
MAERKAGTISDSSMPSKRTPCPMGLLCLMFLLAVPASGLNCSLLKLQQKRTNRQSVELLKEMKGRLPAECLHKMPALSFPVKILEIRQPRSATKAVLEILQGILHLLKEDHLWVAWEATLRKSFALHLSHGLPGNFKQSVQSREAENSVTNSDNYSDNWTFLLLFCDSRFLEQLHAQTQRIQRCLEGGKPTPGKNKDEWMNKLQLKKYFRSIRNFLEEKGLDGCTQQFLRHEIQMVFTYMDRLTEGMKI